MRLPIVSHGHRLREKLILLIIRITRGSPAPDIVRTLFYRPEFFGKTMSAWTQAVMRGRRRGPSRIVSSSPHSRRPSITVRFERKPTARSRRKLTAIRTS